jgi:hypothetical protein
MTGTSWPALGDAAVEQEIIISPDGGIEIRWIHPRATGLVLKVYQDVSGEPFPIGVIMGEIYCG